MNLELLEFILITSINLLGFVLIFLVLKSNSRLRLNQFFALMTVFSLFWVDFSYLGFTTRTDEGLFFFKANFAAVSLFLATFYLFFVKYFLNLKLKSYVLSIIPAFSILFAFVSVLSDQIIKSISYEDNNVEIVYGSLGDLFNLFALAVGLAIMYILVKNYLKSTGPQKVKVQYFFIGVVFYVLANIIFNVIFPLVFKTISLSRLGDYSVFIFLGFSAYAIVRHKLMDIRMVVARSFAFIALLVTIAVFAGILMMLLPTMLFGHEILDNPTYNIIIRSFFGIILVFTFQPLKKWIEKVTDKIFFRNEYDSHELIKKITDTSHSTLMLIELLYKTVDLMIKEMKVSKGHFVLLDDGGDIHTTQAIGFQNSPELKATDVKGLATHGILVLENIDDSSHFKRILKKADAAVSIGLMDETGPIGALILGEKNSGDMFSAKDLKVLGILAMSISVAIQRAKEHEKVQNFNVYLQAEVARKTKELQEANDHLRELDKAKDEFISMASHQLRTPLTAIKGYLSMLLEGDAGDIKMAQYDFINEAFDGANRMVALINDLLNVSRMDTGRFFLEPVKIDLVKMINSEIKQLEQTAKEKNLYLKFVSKEKEVVVTADETKIRQAVMNFIDNALYYTSTGGATIYLEKDKTNVKFRVVDTGMGVPEAELQNLFNKFYRADNARKVRPDGTGLGIYLAKKVIEDHGGEIIFDSVEGKGSTFGFKLPLKNKIKKEITVPPADLATKVEGIGSGEEKKADESNSVIFVK